MSVVACPGRPDCERFLPHEHTDSGQVWTPRAPESDTETVTLQTLRRDMLLLGKRIDAEIRRQYAADERAYPPAPAPDLVEKHVLVQQLLRRADLFEERVAELERKLAIVWRRVL